MSRSCYLLLLPVLWLDLANGEEKTPLVPLAESIPAFVETYCINCHDDLSTKGDRDFLPFLDAPHSPDQFLALAEILDQLNLGEMPPKKDNVDQPAEKERRAIVDEITRYLLAESETHKARETVLRRLTRHEYRNTMRDLLGVDPNLPDPTVDFPADAGHHGFTNIGDAQILSDHLLNLYLKAAKTYVDSALVFYQEKPDPKEWNIVPTDFTKNTVGAAQVAWKVVAEDGTWFDIGHGEPNDRRPSVPDPLKRGLPADGIYRITVKASGIGRDHGYDPEILGIDTSQPIKLGVWYAEDSRGLDKTTIRGRKLVEIFSLKDNQADTHETTAWIPKGGIPFFNWINGSGAAKRPVRMILEKYHPEAIRIGPTQVDEMRQNGIKITDAEVEKHNDNIVPPSKVYRGPRLRIFEIKVEGPLAEEWPPASHRKLVGNVTDANDLDIADTLTAFASRAYRRPVTEREIGHHIGHVYHLMGTGKSSAKALEAGFTSILCSPKFLFLNEGALEDSASMNIHQFASRLSYFFWSTMPDDRLRELANNGTLLDREVLEKEIDRLIDDPRSGEFARHFGNAWLRLDKLGTMPPGPKQFPTYLRRRLEQGMRTETEMLLSHILKENLSPIEFITADYSFLNDNMAEHYRVPGVEGESFRKVALPAGSRRRGILGHASILTATANGVETSPVTRGVWVLESLLGTPPSPPPPDVPAIEPDIRGATTIREQLEKHRSAAACADCHARIDPWGFALEFYDPIGGLREKYPRTGNGAAKAIDGSATLPNGVTISNEQELADQLLERKERFTKNLIEKLLTYGTGRELGLQDRSAVDQLFQRNNSKKGGFRDLVKSIAMSRTFRQR